jgi:HEAT repeat protein
VRGHAAEALAYIKNKESVDALLRQLQCGNTGVKYWCIFALGQIAGPNVIAALKQFSENAGDESYEKHSLRAEALNAIAEIVQRSKDFVSEETDLP